MLYNLNVKRNKREKWDKETVNYPEIFVLLF